MDKIKSGGSFQKRSDFKLFIMIPALKKEIREQKQIKVRCPSCLKLYQVSEDKIIETRPEFQCKNCLSFFYFEYPEYIKRETKEILGLPSYSSTSDQRKRLQALQKRNLKKKIRTLPQYFCRKCLTPHFWGDKDCLVCGLIFEKQNSRNIKKETSSYSSNPEIRQVWKNILKNYQNKTLHEHFLRICQVENQIGYAISKYQDILQVNPDDKRAQKSIKRLKSLASLPFIRQKLTEKHKKKLHLPWIHFLLTLSFGFITTGFLIPFLINFIGLGIALAFFSLALRFYFQNVF